MSLSLLIVNDKSGKNVGGSMWARALRVEALGDTGLW